MSFRRLLALLASLGALTGAISGCASVDPGIYADQQPRLELQRYFDGTLEGHGMFSDRSGEVKRRFVVTITASWKDGTGTLDERFVWSDGERERRVWTLRPDGPGRWIGTADGVIGEARGVVSGNALHWTYRYRLRTGEGSSYDLSFDDWMFLVDERVMLNRAEMRYFGFKVGEVLISFRRP
jgi:hypothetical protein